MKGHPWQGIYSTHPTKSFEDFSDLYTVLSWKANTPLPIGRRSRVHDFLLLVLGLFAATAATNLDPTQVAYAVEKESWHAFQ